MRTRMQGRVLRALTSTLVLTLLATLLLAGAALAADTAGRAKSAKPGKPTATAPKGTITLATPTFKWEKVRGAAKYELRVYQGKEVALKMTGLKKTTWTAVEALPTKVDLTWKVRAGNASGSGPWSKSLTFKIVPAFAIGDPYGGGIVAYILQSGDPGYVAGQTHGLIAATADQTGGSASDGIQWAREPYWYTDLPGAKGTALGTGAANTNAIIAQNGAGTDYAAGLARAYAGGGYSDWYLPSKDELNKLYLNRAAIGGFHTSSDDWPYYWSSSQDETNAPAACYQDFDGGDQSVGSKTTATSVRVRAVRAF